MRDGIFWADVLRAVNIILTSVCAGAFGYGLWLYFRNRRAQLTQASPVALALTFSASYLILLLSGIVIDIVRIHQPLSAYTPVHLLGVVIGIVSLYISARIAIATWRKGKKL